MTTDVAAVTAQTLSLPFFLALIAVGIVLMGALAYVVAARRGGGEAGPPPGVERLGYGRERWERQLALWQGVMRRLEIQARGQDPIPERLEREMAEAKAKVAEARARLDGRSS